MSDVANKRGGAGGGGGGLSTLCLMLQTRGVGLGGGGGLSTSVYYTMSQLLFHCFSLVKSKPEWLHPEEFRFKP